MDENVSRAFFPIFEGLLHRVVEQRPIRSKFLICSFNENYSEDVFSQAVLASEWDINLVSKLTDMITTISALEIPDVLMITPSADKISFDFDIWSPKFVGRYNIHEPELRNSVRIDVTNESHPLQFKYQHGKDLYQNDKLLNLQQRYMEVATFNYYPYSSYDEVVSFIQLLHHN